MTENEQPINGAGQPMTVEQIQAQQIAAMEAFGRGLIAQLQRNGGQLNPLQMSVDQKILDMRVKALFECSAATGLDLLTFHERFCALLHAEADRMSGPQIQLAVGAALRKKQ
jgi:hypothetical protein